jgi:hypothetical protein
MVVERIKIMKGISRLLVGMLECYLETVAQACRVAEERSPGTRELLCGRTRVVRYGYLTGSGGKIARHEGHWEEVPLV